MLIFSILPYDGMTLFPFILLKHRKYESDKVLLNHEHIHLIQQKELLILPFYFFYSVNYFVNLIRFRNHHKAYTNIIFEKEAYANEKNKDYIITRKPWSFLKYRGM
ncbi:MAG: hypothetical protein ABI772_06690 [Bacteroidota bacterium]